MKTQLHPDKISVILNRPPVTVTATERPTRRQQKHDMLLTFMDNSKKATKPARRKLSLLKSVMSLFL